MKTVYNATSQGNSTSVPTGGTEVVWSDATGPRVSRISVSGMDHDWPAHNGGSVNHFVNNKIDYPNHITQWFFDNNRRVSSAPPPGPGNAAPTIDSLSGSVNGNTVSMTCTASDSDGTVDQVDTELLKDGAVQASHTDVTNCSDSYTGLSDGTYQIRVTVTDDDGDTAVSSTANLQVGDWNCVEYVTRNTDHYNATPQRATATLNGWTWHYYAAGSGAELSATGAYSTTTVSETSEGYFEAGECPAGGGGGGGGGGNNQPPAVSVNASSDGDTINMTCTAFDNDGTVDDIDAELLQNGSVVTTHNNLSSCNTSFTGLSEGIYQVRVTVTDNEGATATDTSASVGVSDDWVCQEYYTQNTTHYNANPQRVTAAYVGFAWHYYAVGSGEEVSATGPFSYTYVSETSDGYYEAGTCP